jgi:hypothetical protein
MINRPKFYVYLPIVFALVLILGIFIGHTFHLDGKEGNVMTNNSAKFSKINDVLRYVTNEYKRR